MVVHGVLTHPIVGPMFPSLVAHESQQQFRFKQNVCIRKFKIIKRLISYKTENGTSIVKKFMKLNTLTFKKCILMRLYDNILLKQMPLKNKVPRFQKW